MSLNEAGHATIAAYKENVFSVFLPFLGPEDPSNRKNTHHFFAAKLSEIAERFQKCIS